MTAMRLEPIIKNFANWSTINGWVFLLTRSLIILNTTMENENTSCANISIPFPDRNISKTCVFIFYHSIQDKEASSYTFYNEGDYPN